VTVRLIKHRLLWASILNGPISETSEFDERGCACEADSVIAVFLIPVSFYLVEKFCSRQMVNAESHSEKFLTEKEHPHE